jgi:hypothetical protein
VCVCVFDGMVGSCASLYTEFPLGHMTHSLCIYLYTLHIIYIYTIVGLASDQVMGGISTGNISREMIHGRNANVLRGTVRLDNHGGFIQMATNLASSHSSSATSASASSTTTIPTATTSWYTSTRPVVDASKYHGIELDVLCCGSSSPTTSSLETFNVQ